MVRYALAATVAIASALPHSQGVANAQTPPDRPSDREPDPAPHHAISQVVGDAPGVRLTHRGGVVVENRALGTVDDAVAAGVLALPGSAGALVFVAHHDNSLSIWDANARATRPAQVIRGLGRGLADLTEDRVLGRVLVLAAASAEVFSIQPHPPMPTDRQADPAYVDHARACDFLEQGERARAIAVAANPAFEPSGTAQPPTVLLLATDRRVLVLAHADRSYRVLERRSLPDGLARVEAMAASADRWYVAAWTRSGQPKLFALDPDAPHDPPADLTPTLAQRLTEAAGLGREPNWLVHGLRRDGGGVAVDVGGEWPAVVRLPALEITSPAADPDTSPAPPGSP